MPDSTPVCRRCGRCCELGGPGLLRDDAPLLSSGALRPEMLVCLRRGQWARQDGMGGGLAQLENEMIKLAGTGKAPHPWQCLAYAPGTGCTIYERRPVQCGVLFCEDTRPLEALLRDVPALDRRAAIALLPLPDAQRRLWEELVQAHEEACDVRQYFVMGLHQFMRKPATCVSTSSCWTWATVRPPRPWSVTTPPSAGSAWSAAR